MQGGGAGHPQPRAARRQGAGAGEGWSHAAAARGRGSRRGGAGPTDWRRAPGERAGRASEEGGARGARATAAPAPRLPRLPRATVPLKLPPGRRAAGGGRGLGPARAGPAGGGMGTRQTKGSLAERASPGAAPGPRRERPDFWASLLLRAGDKAGRAGAGLPPYHRRVGMVQELLRMVRQGRREEAGTLLQHLRQVSAKRGKRGGGGAAATGAPRPCEVRRAGGGTQERPAAPPRVPLPRGLKRCDSRCLSVPPEFGAPG